LASARIYKHRLVRRLGAHCNDSGNEHRLVSCNNAKPDGIGLARDTRIVNVDVVIASGQIGACQRAQRDVERAGGIAKRIGTDGYILASGVVTEKSTRTKRGVVAASSVML
jgi:hypothetical protein